MTKATSPSSRSGYPGSTSPADSNSASQPPSAVDPASAEHSTGNPDTIPDAFGARSPAGLGARFAARLLDILILPALAYAYTYAVIWLMAESRRGGSSTDPFTVAILVIFFLIIPGVVILVLFYEVAMPAMVGRTFGKMLLRIRIVRADNGGSISWLQSFGRWIISMGIICLVCLPPGLVINYLIAEAPFENYLLANGALIGAIIWLLVLGSFIYILVSRNDLHQGPHDRIAKTLVIKNIKQPTRNEHRSISDTS